ncbi:MAG: DUF3341 domain-containing protein [Flavobacteriales bacterium TMED288]|jgi:hypothetical protein|nr:hypothetical protein [Flavobacteriales bacterium]RPG53514.1 MAG: DUF3341 domain-containing protein [Flavobacteriales bacterium TMED288]|tara:strand:+ start:2060 stop:2578 length:519 start_codon:yes stop_codon:yes gene_type:complete
MDYKTIYGIYNDDDTLLSAVKKIRGEGISISEVYSPFPIHGLDKALGLKDTRLAVTAFLYGLTGLSLGLLMMWYMNIQSWPMNIGGKPSFSLLQNLPSFIPVAFECTVFFAAHLMVITYLMRCKLYPGSSNKSPDPRTTDNMFLMEIIVKADEKKIYKLLEQTGAVEVNEKV